MERGRIHSFQFDNNEAGILEYGLLARAHLRLVSSGSTMALSRQAYLDERTRNDKDRLYIHRTKLLGGGQMGSILSFHLPLPDHMHLYEHLPFEGPGIG